MANKKQKTQAEKAASAAQGKKSKGDQTKTSGAQQHNAKKEPVTPEASVSTVPVRLITSVAFLGCGVLFCVILFACEGALLTLLERLIHGCGGTEEVERFLGCCRRGSMYVPADPVLQKIREGMFVSVISSHRLESILPAVFTTHGYLMSPYTALAYGGLLDYRAKSGHMHHGIVLSERSPVHDAKTVCGCMNISEEQLAKLL